jgi:hypothetical protein
MYFSVIIVTLLFLTTILITHYSSDQVARAQSTTSCFTSSNPADSDGDGLSDDWENNGVPYTKSDGTTGRYILPGANSNHKDAYIEIDAMQLQVPLNRAIIDFVDAFQNAPVKNPDCLGGIVLHVDMSDRTVDQKEDTDIPELYQLKNIWFGDPSERIDINHEGLLAAKDRAYYYVLFAKDQPKNQWDKDGSSSGKADNIPGKSLLVTLGRFGSNGLPVWANGIGSVDQEEGTLMHEFGHLLGLKHGGDDHAPAYKPNYPSVMNYMTQFSDPVPFRPLDYSRCSLPTLNEIALNEKAGIGNNNCPQPPQASTALDAGKRFGGECPDQTTVVPLGGFPVDFNHDNNSVESPIFRDINCDGQFGILTSYDDWGHIVFLANPGARTSGASLSLIGGTNTTSTSAHAGTQPGERELNFQDVQQHRASLVQGLEQLVQQIPLSSVNNTASALSGLAPRSAVNGSALPAAASTSSKVKNTILNQIGDPAKIVANASRQNLTGATAGAAINTANNNTSGADATIKPSVSSLIASNQLPQAINQLSNIQSSLTGSSGGSTQGSSSNKVLADPSDIRKVNSAIENIKSVLAKETITPEDAERVGFGQIISPSSTGAPSVSATPATTANVAATTANIAATPSSNAPSNAISGPSNANIVMWISHLDLLAGDPSVQTSFNAISSGVGNGLSGLIIQSNTTGYNATQGGNKVVQKALEVPPGHAIKGIRLCYELSNNRTFLNQIRLAQVQNPPDRAIVLLDDLVSLNNKGPICVNSQQTVSTIDPANGPLMLSLRINSGDASDRIVIRGLGLLLG